MQEDMVQEKELRVLSLDHQTTGRELSHWVLVEPQIQFNNEAYSSKTIPTPAKLHVLIMPPYFGSIFFLTTTSVPWVYMCLRLPTWDLITYTHTYIYISYITGFLFLEVLN